MHSRLRRVPGGGFPVPGAIQPDQLPPAVKLAILRPLEGPPKPAVTKRVMNEAQRTMLAPDLPNRTDV